MLGLNPTAEATHPCRHDVEESFCVWRKYVGEIVARSWTPLTSHKRLTETDLEIDAEAIEVALREGLPEAMNRFNAAE